MNESCEQQFWSDIWKKSIYENHSLLDDINWILFHWNKVSNCCKVWFFFILIFANIFWSSEKNNNETLFIVIDKKAKEKKAIKLNNFIRESRFWIWIRIKMSRRKSGQNLTVFAFRGFNKSYAFVVVFTLMPANFFSKIVRSLTREKNRS
jgi:hypothetical protein